MKLEKFGVQELGTQEMRVIDGGKGKKKGRGWLGVLIEAVIEYYPDIVKEVIDGYKKGTIDNVGSKR